jgi:hypothetical protein
MVVKNSSMPNPDDQKILNIRPIDLTQAEPRRKGVNDPELLLKWNSYTAEGNRLGTKEILRVAKAVKPGSTQPDYLAISELTDGSGDIAAIPTLQQSNQTLEVKWTQGGKTPRISFETYFALRRFPIPKGTTAHIPIETLPVKTADGPSDALVIHFSQASFQPIVERKKNNAASNNSKTEAANTKQDDSSTSTPTAK